jgi:hypothetical protein
MAKGEAEDDPLIVVPGPLGLHRFMHAYRAAEDDADITLSFGTTEDFGDVLLMAVDGVGTVLPFESAPRFITACEGLAEDIDPRDAEAFRRLARQVRQLCDAAEAMKAPKH